MMQYIHALVAKNKKYMKTLIVVRHAKSSWANPEQQDFDRPLNERGKNDAPKMAKRLISEGVKIDAFVSSPAKRAKQTCEAFVAAYGRDKEDIIFIDKLYHAPAGVYYEAISEVKNKYDRIAVFGHNPGITEFVNSLHEQAQSIEMPTCAIFAAKADVEKWEDFEAAEKNVLFYKYPKEV